MDAYHLRAGDVVGGDFRVVRPLKRGGMGSVYVAEQLSTGRTRALKLMHPQLVEDAALRRRFEQEARVGARIKSDHVVQVVAAGVDAAIEMPYLAMELLEGEDLGALLARRERLDPAEVGEIFAQLCHALEQAHAAGIVHRDLKPENVFLATSQREGTAFTLKVLDFGIAKVVADANLTTTSAVGTPLWMAPEQTETGGAISPATDVWALGLIAFRALSGKLYWRGGGGAGSAASLLREIVLEPLPPASQRADELGCGITLPNGFDAWFARCVAREPRDRFENAAEARAPLAEMLGPRTSRTSLRGLGEGSEHVLETANTEHVIGSAPTERITTSGAGAIETVPEPEEPLPALPSSRSVAPYLAVAVLVLAAGGWAVLGRDKGPGARVPPLPPTPVEEVRRCPGGMASLPSGSVTIRTEAIEVPAFCIDVSEVTVAEYRGCTGCPPPAATIAWPGATDDDRAKWGRLCNGPREGRDTHPMNCISFADAAAYCRAQAKRLPTEAEWQWAAQGARDGRLHPWGTTAPESQLCWSGVADRLVDGSGTCPVGASPAGDTVAGLHDMAGGVAEWTSTTFAPGDDERVVRGGSFADDAPMAFRTSTRDHRPAATKSASIGFRCAFP